MFDRFIQLAKAKKALRDQRFEDALQLAIDPLICNDRRAAEVCGQATDRLLLRARQRLLAGDVGAAKTELARLQSLVPSAAVAALAAEIEVAASGDAEAIDIARRSLGEVRRLIDRGECAAARALLAAVGRAHLLHERQHLEHLLSERGTQAAVLAAQARTLLDSGAVAEAFERLGRAEALDRDAGEVAAIRPGIVAMVVQTAAAAIGDLRRGGNLGAAIERFASVCTVPDAANAEPLLALRRELGADALAALRTADSVVVALPIARAVRAADLAVDEPLRSLVDSLLVAESRLPAGDEGTAATLQAAAKSAGACALATFAGGLLATATDRQLRLSHARTLRDGGQIDEARLQLEAFLAEQPTHAAARRELDLVDQGLLELDRRVAEVRAAVREGRLRHACTAAVSLVGSGRAATEAQRIVADARARMALVDRGLDEVRVSLHGRVASSQEGVRHCLLRLEELAKVQADHEELPGVIRAVQIEIDALATCDRATAALERRAVGEAITAIAAVLPLRENLMARDRLDARLLALADRVGQLVGSAVETGRLAEGARCIEFFAKLEVVRPDFVARAESLRSTIAARQSAAVELVNQALARLTERDLAEAERLAELAQRQWGESPEARALVARLGQVRRQADVLDRVEVLTRERDYLGAQQKLADMPPAEQLLRTRIYDMKQNLARAQGLDGAFLLRVDEGGEHLVVRGETVAIGNVRQNRADLPVLASIAGRHASIRRSMSFHGGMQDTLVAEEGEVRVGGALVASHALAHGDRALLGAAFAFVYQRPCSRSLSVSLLLQGGFQIAGTDRIFLMKDRGRDGRLLLGTAKDVHVRVQKASGEVEVFSTSSGQMRVACDAGGSIDGVPFRGEHPVAAGQVVEAAGISFLLLPWRPTV